MSLLWNRQTGVVRRESCMFAGTDHARLLFPAAELLRISCPALGTEYLPGRDCTLSDDGRTLKLLPDSRIPRLTARELHPEEPEARFFPAPDADAIRGGVDGRNLRFERVSFKVDGGRVYRQIDGKLSSHIDFVDCTPEVEAKP